LTHINAERRACTNRLRTREESSPSYATVWSRVVLQVAAAQRGPSRCSKTQCMLRLKRKRGEVEARSERRCQSRRLGTWSLVRPSLRRPADPRPRRRVRWACGHHPRPCGQRCGQWGPRRGRRAARVRRACRSKARRGVGAGSAAAEGKGARQRETTEGREVVYIDLGFGWIRKLL